MNTVTADEIINRLAAQILQSKEELTSVINASEARLILALQDLKDRVNFLEEENNLLKNKLEKVERTNRKNNIVIFGFQKEPKEISLELVLGELNGYLESHILKEDINNIFCLGKHKNCPVKIEFISYLKKQEVQKKVYKLKNSGLSISPDLTRKQQEESRILRKHLNVARTNDPLKKSYIRGNKLVVGDSTYTIEKLLDEEQQNKALGNTSSSSISTISRSQLKPGETKNITTLELPDKDKDIVRRDNLIKVTNTNKQFYKTRANSNSSQSQANKNNNKK